MINEEIEDSIEYKFNNFYNEETLKLTIEEAKYIFSGANNFCDVIIDAAAKTLIQYINQLEEKNNKQNKIIDEMTIMLEELKICHFKKEDGGEMLGKYRCYNKEDWKLYFKKKVEGK